MNSRFFPGLSPQGRPRAGAAEPGQGNMLFNPLLALTGAGAASVVSSSLSLYLPDGYEAKYPYPLLVWLHGDDNSEQQLHDILPRLSERNYVGVGFRGPVKTGNGFTWGNDVEQVDAFEEVLYPTLCAMRKTYHIHSERIYLGGTGSGAAMAIQMLLHRPEWFRGAFVCCRQAPAVRPVNTRHPLLHEKRLLLNRLVSSEEPLDVSTAPGFPASAQMFHSKGLETTTRDCHPGTEGEPFSALALQELNYWLMTDISSATLV